MVELPFEQILGRNNVTVDATVLLQKMWLVYGVNAHINLPIFIHKSDNIKLKRMVAIISLLIYKYYIMS